MTCTNTTKCAEPCGHCPEQWPVPAGSEAAQSPAEAHGSERDAQEQPFEDWWEREGQFGRAGGGQYEKTFAWNAWCAASNARPEHAHAALIEQRLDAIAERARDAGWDVDRPEDVAPLMQAEIDRLTSALAACRDAFPIPEPGAPHENAWMLAMGDPAEVPDYVRAAIAANVQPKGTEPVYRRRTDAEALDCANRLNRSFPPSNLKDEAADHIRELVAVVQAPAPGAEVQAAPKVATTEPATDSERSKAMGAWLGAVGDLFIAMGRPEVPGDTPVDSIAAIVREAAERIAAKAEPQAVIGLLRELQECGAVNNWLRVSDDLKRRVEAAIATQPTQAPAVKDEPTENDWRLPADLKAGHVTFRKGVHCSALVSRMKMLHETAFGVDCLTPEQKAENLAALQACKMPPHEFAPPPPAATLTISVEGSTTTIDCDWGDVVRTLPPGTYPLRFSNVPVQGTGGAA